MTRQRRYPLYKTISHASLFRRMAGIAYLEVLIATVLIMITLVPSLESLQPALAVSTAHGTRTADQYQVIAKLEEVLAEPFGNLDQAASAAGNATTATSYSDTVTYTNGRQVTRNVFLSRYDGDNADADNDPFTGVDPGLLWVRVEIAGSLLSVEAMTSVYQ